jgi:hypothetical protein
MSEKNGNWWEFYGIRYAQGAVVGALLVFLIFSQNETLKKILILPAENKDFGVPHLILLAVYGLVYCYISSAPILIMHAARGLLFKSAINPNPSEGWISRLLTILGPSVAIVLFYWLIFDRDFSKCAAIFLFCLLVLFQFRLIYEVFYKSWPVTINYYKSIIGKRAIGANLEFVESYKHIREHGNSFLIVIFQFLLAVPLFMIVGLAKTPESTISNLMTLVIFWIFPGSFIWMFGNKLENYLQDS